MTVVLLCGKCLPNVLYHCGSHSAFASSSALILGREGSDRHVPLRAEPAPVSVLWASELPSTARGLPGDC